MRLISGMFRVDIRQVESREPRQRLVSPNSQKMVPDRPYWVALAPLPCDLMAYMKLEAHAT